MLVKPMIVYYMLMGLFHLKKHVRVNSAAADLNNLGTNKPLPILVGSKEHEGPSGKRQQWSRSLPSRCSRSYQ